MAGKYLFFFSEGRANGNFFLRNAVTIGLLSAIWTQAVFFFDKARHLFEVAAACYGVVREGIQLIYLVQRLGLSLESIWVPFECSKRLEVVLLGHNGLEHLLVIQLDEALVNVEEVQDFVFEAYLLVARLLTLKVAGFALFEEFAELRQILVVVAQEVVQNFLLGLRLKLVDVVLEVLSKTRKRVEAKECRLIRLNRGRIWVLIRIDVEDLADLLPCVLSPDIGRERHSQVLVPLLVSPGDDSLALPVELDVGLDDLVLEQVDRIVLLLKQRQFVLLTMGYVVDPKVAGTEIVPTPVGVESVELGSKVLQWVPVKLNVFWLGRAAAA